MIRRGRVGPAIAQKPTDCSPWVCLCPSFGAFTPSCLRKNAHGQQPVGFEVCGATFTWVAPAAPHTGHARRRMSLQCIHWRTPDNSRVCCSARLLSRAPHRTGTLGTRTCFVCSPWTASLIRFCAAAADESTHTPLRFCPCGLKDPQVISHKGYSVDSSYPYPLWSGPGLTCLFRVW